MSNKSQRRLFSVGSKYQWQIVSLVIISTVVCYFLLACFVNFVLSQAVNSFVNKTPSGVLVGQVTQWTIKVIFIFIVLSFIFGLLALVFSQNLVGAFGRINRELDDIIAGRSKKTITVRPRDEFANDLLKRVNVLIGSYVGQGR